MRRIFYPALLALLRLAVYIKRMLLAFSGLLLQGVRFCKKIYRQTVGFHVYKGGLFIYKQLGRPFSGNFAEIIGSRRTLEVLLLLTATLFTIPKSNFIRYDSTATPGKQTLLFTLAGPGDQDFTMEEIRVDVTATAAPDERSWRFSGVRSELSGRLPGEESEKTGPHRDVLTRGGATALLKQTIMPWATIENNTPTARRTIVYHEVVPGDVLGAIAANYGLQLETILAANNLNIRSPIRPGDKLAILPVDGVTYTIKKGDTLSKIAQTYDAKVEDIIAFNALPEDGGAIAQGDFLILPGGRLPTSARPTVIVSRPSTANPSRVQPASISAPGSGGYIWPTNVRRVTQYYGLRHTGVDIAGPVGSPLYAAKGGKVIRSQCGWNGGYGCHVILDHGGGITTLYGHASQLFVKVGDTVEQGEIIAFMGSTGRSTGPHIHFEVRLSGRKANPLQYVTR